MSEPTKREKPFFTLPRTFTLAAVTLLVSAGLCGIQFKFQPNDYVTIEGILGAIGLLAGGGLLLGGIVGAIVTFVMRLVKSRKNEP